MWGPLLHWFMRSMDTEREWPIEWLESSVQSSQAKGDKLTDSATSAAIETTANIKTNNTANELTHRLTVIESPEDADLEDDYVEQRGEFLFKTVEGALQILANAKGEMLTCMSTQIASAFTLHQFRGQAGKPTLSAKESRAQAEVQLRLLSEHPEYRPWYAAIVSTGTLKHQGQMHTVLLFRFFDADERYGQTYYVPYRWAKKTLTVLGPAYYVGQEQNLMAPVA